MSVSSHAKPHEPLMHMSKRDHISPVHAWLIRLAAVVLALCDRIMVLCDGRVQGVVDARTATKEQIGLMMTSSDKGGHD